MSRFHFDYIFFSHFRIRRHSYKKIDFAHWKQTTTAAPYNGWQKKVTFEIMKEKRSSVEMHQHHPFQDIYEHISKTLSIESHRESNLCTMYNFKEVYHFVCLFPIVIYITIQHWLFSFRYISLVLKHILIKT